MEKYEELLDMLGMKMSLQGYTYWAEAIAYCISHYPPSCYSFYMRETCRYIANKYDSTYAKVDRALRHAIQTTPEFSKKLQAAFKLSYVPYKNSDILACLVRLARREEASSESGEI